MRASEAGFSLVDVLLAGALFAVLMLGTFEAVRLLAGASRQLAARHAAYAAAERVAAQLRADARSATAIWSSSPAAGPAPDDCVQLDFYAADSAGPAFWSYRVFPNHPPTAAIPGDVLQRVAARAPVPPCDPSLAGTSVLDGLRGAFTVSSTPPASLAAHVDAVAGTPDSAFVANGVPATAPVALGVLDAARAPVVGGNAVVEATFATADASRAVDLVPGTFPNGFTEVLRYSCSARCDAGHDTAAPKTLTTCAMAWQPGWSIAFPGGWFIGGAFVFTYSGTRASDGGTDTLAKPYTATNWDVSRDYAAFPPDRAAPDGSRAGSLAPFDVRAEAASAWFADFGPFLAAGERPAAAAEQARCDAVRAQGEAGGFLANG